MSAFDDIHACVFDAYGTLFDVHSAIGRHREQLGVEADALSALWRTKQLEYTWQRSLMGAYVDFWQITQDALDYAMDSFGVSAVAWRDVLMGAYLRLDCYPEVKSVLTTLKEKGIKTAILSNGTRDMVEQAAASAGIRELLDGIYTVEDVGIYKPDARVYRLACDGLGLDAGQISFQSSNAWDAAAAAHFGMAVVWINRTGQPPERLPAQPHAECPTLADLPQLISAG